MPVQSETFQGLALTEMICAQPPPTLPAKASVQDALTLMAKTRSTCVFVADQGALKGIFTERDLVRLVVSHRDLSSLELSAVMSRDLITIHPADIQDFFQVSRLFARYRMRHLPVVDAAGQLLGIVTPQSLRNNLKPEYMLRYARVAEVMSQNVVVGHPHETLAALAQRMDQTGASCIVIMQAGSSIPQGIVTERDLVSCSAQELPFNDTHAQAVMSQPLSVVQPHTSLWHTHQQMQAMQVRRLVVSNEQGELCGIVTQMHILRRIDPSEMYLVMEQMQHIIDQKTAEIQRLNLQLQHQNQHLETLAAVDGLTTLANRRSFDQYLVSMWSRHSQHQQPLALLMCDIDEFKHYNDYYGHPEGDRCLRRVAQALQKHVLRPEDMVARYGGEEFAIILPQTDKAGAITVASRLLTAIADLTIPHQASSIGEYVSLSIGVASMIPTVQTDWQALLQAADQCLYQAKQKGRNTWHIS